MSNKRIRHLSVEMFERPAFVYYVGQTRRLPINGKDEHRTITEIEQNDTHYILYIADGAVSQQWIDIPKSPKVTVEYFI